jgi:hypothetical protein
MPDTSPRITANTWGRLEIEGQGTFKDAKLWPGGAREWDWHEHGTDHRPGIQPADAEELVDRGARTVILSRGRQNRLNVPQETVDAIIGRGVEVKVLPTDEAITAYNRLVGDRAVGALIHSTC